MVIDIPGSSHKNRFCCIFLFYEICMGNLMYSSCELEYCRVELHGKEAAILWDEDKLFLRNG